MFEYRRRTAWLSALALSVAASLVLSGCNSDDDPVTPPVATTIESTFTITAEPEFTAGQSNEISWVMDEVATKNGADLSYLIEMSPDATFTDEVAASLWLDVTNHTFTELTDGQTLYYRVMARDGEDRTSAWSPAVSSTQDSSAPTATVVAFGEDETSLLFDVEVTAEDAISGVVAINLWFRKNAGEWQLHGPVEAGITSFQTDEGGPHEFIAVATDIVGNEQEMPAEAQAETLVPEQIILVDGLGFEWDVTNAVLKHHIQLSFWAHGIGRNTIRPVIDPVMAHEGDVGFPSPTSLQSVIAINYDGDKRAYSIGLLSSREVADDVVNGVPIAVTY